ncbi:Cytochrome P450 monooxygenase azaI [Colletotrichum sidae]|uniref:Cytochrome P450 monooxygenase azaI n=1 Tax=Colletotrichum sidae TaxID=1347389 RepID=A0A4R8TRP0_9PEZI|nr:Cytochrome P450 monooxygenase azaI [Colletotrichum sidae]
MESLSIKCLYLANGVCFAVLALYIYNGLTNPLSHIPGPWWTRFAAFPATYKFMTAHQPDWIHDLHAKYGPVVRYSPTEVDVSDPKTAQYIHSVKSGYLKTPFYSLLVTDSSSVFNEIRPELHRKYKRLLAYPMSETGLKTFFPRIDKKVRFAIESIRNEHNKTGAADVAKWFMLLSFDVIGDLAFGQSFGNLENGKRTQSVTDFVSLGYVSGLRIAFPIVSRLARYLPIPVFKDATAIQFRTFDYTQRALDRHFQRVEEKGVDDHPMVFSKAFATDQEEQLTRIEMRDNAQVFIVGGSDTTANSMIYLVWAVCRNPAIKARLLAELDSLPDDYDYDALKNLAYLNMIIQETLRLYTALPGGLPRSVPPGGEELAGHFIPGGFTVATQAYSLHRDETAFPDPFQFKPERWEQTSQRMKDCLMPFGGGARVSSSEVESITAVLHAYGAALKRRDVEETLSLYTSDGVIMPPHFTSAAGTTALRESYTRIFSTIQLEIKFDIEEVVVMSSDWAFARTTAEGTKTMLATQESEPHANQELFIMKKEGSDWKIARYAFSTMKPLVQNGVRRS